jgi:hypothetical protein
MKTKKFLSMLIIILVWLPSCDNDCDCITPSQSEDYFPLNIGDTWHYRNSIHKISSSEIINNKEYKVKLIENYHADTLYNTSKEYYRVKNGKVYQLYSDQSDEFLYVDFNRSENESWKYKSEHMNGDYWHVTALAEREFDFSNGTKLNNCKPFSYDVPEWVDEEHLTIFAPGIGKIYSASLAWGIRDTLQKAQINGVIHLFK